MVSYNNIVVLLYTAHNIIIATEAVDEAAKLKADLVHLWGSSKHAKGMVKELGSSVALCESIIQKMQKANEEREQLQMQLQAQAKELTELKQLKLHKQAGVYKFDCIHCVCMCM